MPKLYNPQVSPAGWHHRHRDSAARPRRSQPCSQRPLFLLSELKRQALSSNKTLPLSPFMTATAALPAPQLQSEAHAPFGAITPPLRHMSKGGPLRLLVPPGSRLPPLPRRRPRELRLGRGWRQGPGSAPLHAAASRPPRGRRGLQARRRPARRQHCPPSAALRGPRPLRRCPRASPLH